MWIVIPRWAVDCVTSPFEILKEVTNRDFSKKPVVFLPAVLLSKRTRSDASPRSKMKESIWAYLMRIMWYVSSIVTEVNSWRGRFSFFLLFPWLVNINLMSDVTVRLLSLVKLGLRLVTTVVPVVISVDLMTAQEQYDVCCDSWILWSCELRQLRSICYHM